MTRHVHLFCATCRRGGGNIAYTALLRPTVTCWHLPYSPQQPTAILTPTPSHLHSSVGCLPSILFSAYIVLPFSTYAGLPRRTRVRPRGCTPWGRSSCAAIPLRRVYRLPFAGTAHVPPCCNACLLRRREQVIFCRLRLCSRSTADEQYKPYYCAPAPTRCSSPPSPARNGFVDATWTTPWMQVGLSLC